jgi:MFS family permease
VSPWAILAVFAVMLDALVLYVAFPSIERSFSAVSSAELSWVLNAYTIVYGALLVPAGRFADQVGRKRAKRESAEPGDRDAAAAPRPGSRAGTAAD